MRLYLICDNEDTALGLRLAGIEGIVTEDNSEVAKKLSELADDKEIGIVLINEKLMSQCSDIIGGFRKNHSLPIITEIPDRHSTGTSSSIADYVSEAIGIKI